MMNHLWLRSFLASIALMHACHVYSEEPARFAQDIQPILSNHCYTCHGPDEKTRQANLRLDLRSAVLDSSGSGVVPVVPGNLEASELFQRITSKEEDLRMPPIEQSHRLTESEIAKIKQWIMEGATYEEHWSFRPTKKPSIPIINKSNPIRNPIDAFVSKRLKERNLTLSGEANRETLVRRVSFDLTGIAPSIDEIDLYINDKRADAYERMVDRFLQSPRYGEHLARYWLDLARYADSNGYQYDTEREQWAWRDWVIHAYNQNMPFDQFTIEQIAGDLLPDATDLQRLATGFNRNHGITIEGGIIDEEYRTEYVMDRVVTTGAVWLGMTIGCARCHDHKYDPITQQEFYELYSIFNQVPERGMRGFSPQSKIKSPLVDPKLILIEETIDRLESKRDHPLDLEKLIFEWTNLVKQNPPVQWTVLSPNQMKSTGGSTLEKLEDLSVLVGGANPNQDIYTITAETRLSEISAIRLEALTHESLPGGGPGRHSNSNFVLSEFEVEAISKQNPEIHHRVKLKKVIADYSQSGYEIGKTIDGTVADNNGWAVDGPTRKASATAIWISEKVFGYEGGTILQFTLKHEANFATHGIGRPRFSITTDKREEYDFASISPEIIAIIRVPTSKRTVEQNQRLKDYYLAKNDPHAELVSKIQSLQNERNSMIPATMIMADLPQPRATHILDRGQYDQPTKKVQPGVPNCLSSTPVKTKIQNRLDFAHWLTNPKHPLTARVAVNRHWRRLFGRGLVESAEDFGRQGDLPTHPDLLDWLAVEFVENDWDVKRLLRSILTSATYRQTSDAPRSSYELDPDNQWLSRGPRFRLDGEQIRDTALAASGILQSQLGGKSVYPYQPEGLWLELNNRPGYSKAYPQGEGTDLVRRSIYSFWKRTVPSPMLKTLDAPEREFCTVRRSRTNTPLQALLLLNGTQFMEAAQFLAARMLLECEGSAEQRITHGFRMVTSRKPTPEEIQILVEEYNDSILAPDSQSINDLKLGKLVNRLEGLSIDGTQLAAYLNVARILLNLDESVTKG